MACQITFISTLLQRLKGKLLEHRLLATTPNFRGEGVWSGFRWATVLFWKGLLSFYSPRNAGCPHDHAKFIWGWYLDG